MIRVAIVGQHPVVCDGITALLKDVEDIEGDRAHNAITLPIKYGKRTALVCASGAIIMLVSSTIVAAAYELYRPVFQIIVTLADLLLVGTIVLIWKTEKAIQMRHASTMIKASMIVGIISIIAGSL